MKTGCKDCQKRVVGCHATCESYAELVAEREAYREHRRQEVGYANYLYDIAKRMRGNKRHKPCVRYIQISGK